VGVIDPLVVDSITELASGHAGRVVVCGSHGGIIAAFYAAKHGVRAAIFNDAGVGLDEAGVAGLAYLEAFGIAAAAVDHRSARIGDAHDTLAAGIVTRANALARACGVTPGATAQEAANRLARAPGATAAPPPVRESRALLADGAMRIWAIDSVVLAEPGDAGHIVVCGSHGGLHGHRPETALGVAARVAVFNDAGIGKDAAGISRLPVLEARGIAGITVAAASARIGSAQSTYADGVISAANAQARDLGALPGLSVWNLVLQIKDRSSG
jgi:hypothetical protein